MEQHFCYRLLYILKVFLDLIDALSLQLSTEIIVTYIHTQTNKKRNESKKERKQTKRHIQLSNTRNTMNKFKIQQRVSINYFNNLNHLQNLLACPNHPLNYCGYHIRPNLHHLHPQSSRSCLHDNDVCKLPDNENILSS